jgi:hypothetical protein
MLTQQGIEQGFPRREMAQQRGQSDVSPTSDISHGRIRTMFGDNLSRNRKNVTVIFLGVSSHRFS